MIFDSRLRQSERSYVVSLQEGQNLRSFIVLERHPDFKIDIVSPRGEGDEGGVWGYEGKGD